MPEDLDALRRENARLEAVLDGGVRERLMSEFGALHVAVGLKKQAGKVTDDLVILVYVPEKLPPDQVPAGRLIPAEIAGIRTDVNIIPEFSVTDSSKYRPVIGGTHITNGILQINPADSSVGFHAGTIGCLASTSDGTTVLLTNWHVLSANTGKVGDTVFQPVPEATQSSLLDDYPKRPTSSENAIAKIANLQLSADVDCAIATINTCYSLCCNCGVHFDNTILGLAINGANVIAGTSAAVAGQQVVKVGATTGRTTGKIVTLSHPAVPITFDDGTTQTFSNQIEITADSGAFSAQGDSGSAIISATTATIVGLLFASSNPPAAPSTLANHIEKVTAALGITINVTPPSAGGSSAAMVTPVAAEPVESLLELMSTRLSQTAGGRALLSGLERHHDETIALVNGERRVTVAWHRNHGPQWLAHAARHARHPEYALPETVEGVSLRDLLLAMAEALSLAGSEALVAEIGRHRGRVERMPDHVAGLDELFSAAVAVDA